MKEKRKPSVRVHIKESVKQLRIVYLNSVRVLAKQVRTEVVIPFCDKRNLRFYSNEDGQVFMSADEGLAGEADNNEGSVCAHFWNGGLSSEERKILDILWIPVYHVDLAEGDGDVIGQYCHSYISPGYKRELARLRKKQNQAALDLRLHKLDAKLHEVEPGVYTDGKPLIE